MKNVMLRKLNQLALTLGLFLCIGLTQGFAQKVIATSGQSKKEIKAETKLSKAKLSLEKSKAKLVKLKASHVKKRQTFEKKNSQGKLSPNDVTKHSRALDNLGNQIDKEQNNIEYFEAFIRENESF